MMTLPESGNTRGDRTPATIETTGVENILRDSPKNNGGKSRSDTIDLSVDNGLQVDISDALSERDKVKFTVHTRTNLAEFKKSDFSVVRQHEEFLWLHNSLVENDDYAGYIIPPAPPRPDFDASREKLQKLGEGEGTMPKEEFAKMKQELEAEYLATFKKTVAMHEVFLQRLAQHPKFRNDRNFHIFLEYENDLSVRGKNKRELLMGIFSNLKSSTDGLVLNTTQKDIDQFFESERVYLNEYYTHIRLATHKADAMTKLHKAVADSYIKLSSQLLSLAAPEEASLSNSDELVPYFYRLGDVLEKLRKTESRVSTDQDLKLSDLLRYYMRDTAAAKELLTRRLRCLANYENANRNLERCRSKNKDIAHAEEQQQAACHKFETISKLAKQELVDFKKRRVVAFRKNLSELAELQAKHAKTQVALLKNCLAAFEDDDDPNTSPNDNQ